MTAAAPNAGPGSLLPPQADPGQPIDVFLVVADDQHPLYRRPHRAARALAADGFEVRSVGVLDQSRGLVSTYVDTEAGL